ncbi:hypothetical protein AB4351_21050, partial [Vibrio sp. 10N.261.51.F11]|uniref:hypothetical protein n=1 Tax=Vibrio sp. 10N.261.51.F11 TaxID=3229678 RepID=UPI003553AD4C
TLRGHFRMWLFLCLLLLYLMGRYFGYFLEAQKQQSDFSNERNRHHFNLCIETNEQLQVM